MKSFLTQVMRKEIFFEVNLTSFFSKCFFQKNKIEIFKTVPNGLFSLKTIDTASSEREAADNFEI